MRLANTTEMQIRAHNAHKDPEPLLYVLVLARRKATAALANLALAKPEDVPALQSEVRVFQDLVGFVRDTLGAGDEAYGEMQPEEQTELIAMLEQESGIPAGEDNDN